LRATSDSFLRKRFRKRCDYGGKCFAHVLPVEIVLDPTGMAMAEITGADIVS
jgi:hypothetical protein